MNGGRYHKESERWKDNSYNRRRKDDIIGKKG